MTPEIKCFDFKPNVFQNKWFHYCMFVFKSPTHMGL